MKQNATELSRAYKSVVEQYNCKCNPQAGVQGTHPAAVGHCSMTAIYFSSPTTGNTSLFLEILLNLRNKKACLN